jgi:superfamily II DNA or RNA helicase
MATSLSYRGYGVRKSGLTDAELEKLRSNLTVQPFCNGAAQQNSFKVYTESSKKIYVPKSYGLAAFGQAEEDNLGDGADIDIKFAGDLRKEQLEPVEAYLKAARDPGCMGGIINLVCGQGKCLARGTVVLMADGTQCYVQDVQVGDHLMGDDSTPRLVVSTCRGREKMYRIVDVSADTAYTVNASHILSLMDVETGQTVDIPLKDYLSLSVERRKQLWGYRVPVEWGACMDAPTPFQTYAHGFDFGNALASALREPNARPQMNAKMMVTSRAARLALVQGVFDACGVRNDTTDSITFPYDVDLEYVLRSLGLKLQTPWGSSLVIPASTLDKMTRDGWVPGAIDLAYRIRVEELSEGDYYGFELDGSNRRFLLGDFTVTHNTVCALYIITVLRKKTLIVVHKDFLLNQWKERIDQFLPNARVGLIKGKTCDTEDKDIVIGSLQSLSMKDYDPEVFSDLGMIVVDECLPYHQLVATVNGPMYIGDIVKLWQVGTPTPAVIAYDESKMSFVSASITHAWERARTQPLVRLKFKGAPDVVCTEGHKILTSHGYSRADDMEVADTLAVKWSAGHELSNVTEVIDKLAEPACKGMVYDLEVDQFHNFVCTDADGRVGVVVHNCHRSGAEVFSRVYRKINTRYSLGLSATVNRKDGLTKVFKWHIGDIVYKGAKRKDTVQVRVVDYKHASPEYSKEWLMFTGKPNTSRMINNICDFLPRTVYIVDLLKEVLATEPERKVLILSDRRKHLETFRELLDAESIENGFYYGGMKPADLKVSEGKQVLLATFAFCAEGLDVARLDTLILASPKSDIVQSVGRILREKEQNRLHVPLIIDIIDNFSMFPCQAKKRIKYYKGQKYALDGSGDDGGAGGSAAAKKNALVELRGHSFVAD